MDIYGHGGDIFAYDDIRHDFSVNINPLGMPEAVKKAVTEHVGDFESYPDTKYRALKAAIANMEQIDAGSVACGNGAADLIYKLCLSQRPLSVLVCAPGFSEYERAALQSGAEVGFHRLRQENGFLLTDRILGDITPETGMVFLCSPNNPTGRVINPGLIEKTAEKAAVCGALLVLDECFLDFTAAQSAKPLIRKYKNLVILKAFTKIFAMAGLRLGYLLCSDPDVIKRAGEFGQCWSVSAPAQYAGAAACGLTGFVAETQNLIAVERDFLQDGIRRLGIRVFESDANFLLLQCNLPLKDLLIEKGILVRSCANFNGLDQSFYRVAVRTRDENTELLRALKEVLFS